MSLSFSQWLNSKSIDCQQLLPELRAALLKQWMCETQRLPKLVVAADLSWPTRARWKP